MALHFNYDNRLTAKQLYRGAYAAIRNYRRDYYDGPYCEYMPYSESLECMIEENRLTAIEAAAARSYLNRFKDELEAREFDKAQAEATGRLYVWASRNAQQVPY